jgi:hypothetical protein
MYNHTKQYRCTIIRGKSQKEMDDLLPAYAKVINEVCPCNGYDFENSFNNSFSQYLPTGSATKKTLDNHRTEICGKLFGMYYFSDDGMVYESERTKKYLQDDDQPAFFKDICYKMQFPNGMQKIQTIEERIKEHICIRPLAFVLKVLQLAEVCHLILTKKDIGYYILNSLDVLQGKATPDEVLRAIKLDRKHGIERIISVPGKASSYSYQHINEQINYLELANLVRIGDNQSVVLNPKEIEAINLFVQQYNQKPEFDVYSWDLSTIENRKMFQFAWDEYFSKTSGVVEKFATSADALIFNLNQPLHGQQSRPGVNLVLIGDEGECIVVEYEKKRVSNFDTRLVNRVKGMGRIKGLGYDVISVVAEAGPNSDFAKFIEVKTTKRVTCPDINDPTWIDMFNFTRNEMIAAMQYKEYYSIFRVYITGNGVKIYVIKDINQQIIDAVLKATPLTYMVEFSKINVNQSIDIN